MRRILLALVVLAAGCGGSSDEGFTIDGDEAIGGVARDATVREIVQAFGNPTSRRGQYETCTLEWPSRGMTMESYYPLGEKDPCGPEARHLSTIVADERWTTSEGLAVGDAVERLRELYPEASDLGGGRWALTVRPVAGVDLPTLEARVENGRVVSFTVHGPRTAG